MNPGSIRYITTIFDSLPQGPVLNFARSRLTVYMADDGISLEAAYRQAVFDAGEHPQHGPVVRAAAVRALGDALVQLPAVQPMLCGQCRKPITRLHQWNHVNYCSQKCGHDAGDRSCCRRGCGCTGFAIKRRQLRQHRQAMRVMEQMIEDYDLDELLERRMRREVGEGPSLDTDSEMDEGSDAEDPMVTQADELRNVDNLVRLSHNMVELAEARRGQKRARGGGQDA